MNSETKCTLIALVGGSGAGKTWLAEHLQREFGSEASALSVDDFYADLSHLMLSERERINFDHPDTIDWPLFESVLHELQNGAPVLAPRYDFTTHSRLAEWQPQYPRPFVFVEGMWLLLQSQIREQFGLKIFLDCPQSLRWQRRLSRDLEKRGRTTESICDKFWNVVAPMHEQFVEVQRPWADLIVEEPISAEDLLRLVEMIRSARSEDRTPPFEISNTKTAAM